MKGSHKAKTSEQYQHELCTEHNKSGPGAFPGFRCCRAAVNSQEVKSRETFTRLVVGALQSLDTFLKISQHNLQSTSLYLLFLTSWDAIASAETEDWQEKCCNLPLYFIKESLTL